MPNQCVAPYEVTKTVVALVLEISTMVGFVCALDTISVSLRSEKMIGVKTMYTFEAMENNSLSTDRVAAIISVERIPCAPRETLEVKNISHAYEHLLGIKPCSDKDLRKTHAVLILEADACRSRDTDVFAGNRLLYIASPARLLPGKINDLRVWIRQKVIHPLIKNCVFSYEFGYIRPSADCNERPGRMWQTLLLPQRELLFAWLPLETLIRKRQNAYYTVLGKFDGDLNATPFVEFMLRGIRDALTDVLQRDQVNVQVSDQVKVVLDALGNETLSANELHGIISSRYIPKELPATCD